MVSEPVGQTVFCQHRRFVKLVCMVLCVSVCVLLHVGGDAFSGLESCRRQYGSLSIQKGRENARHTHKRADTPLLTPWRTDIADPLLIQNSQSCCTVCLPASDVHSTATTLNMKLSSKMDFCKRQNQTCAGSFNSVC